MKKTVYEKPAVRASLVIGGTYKTRGGAVFRVVERFGRGSYLTESQYGWVQEIHGVWLYPDGHIEWDRSSCGRWKEGA